MRRSHLDTLAPCCPVCRAGRGIAATLTLATVVREADGRVQEGILRCPEPSCQREYPILDGVPLLLARLRSWVADHAATLLARRDLSPLLESLVGDCCGPGSAFDTARRHLSSYGWDHWGDLARPEDPSSPEADAPASPAGTVLGLVDRALELAPELARPGGPILDLGTAAGRVGFELAAAQGTAAQGTAAPGDAPPVIGVDLHPTLLGFAARLVAEGSASFPLRRTGVVYDRHRVDLPPRLVDAAPRLGVWAADAADLPFPDGRFTAVWALNLLDAVASPRDVLAEIARVLAPGGRAVLATPWDWSPAATPFEAWVGGHSQRGPDRGASETVLERLLTPGAHPAAVGGLTVEARDARVPWRLRDHARSTVEYRCQLLVVRRHDD